MIKFSGMYVINWSNCDERCVFHMLFVFVFMFYMVFYIILYVRNGDMNMGNKQQSCSMWIGLLSQEIDNR